MNKLCVWSVCRQELERLVEVLRGDVGLDVVELPSDEHQPDGVYVADIAVVVGSVALICNPPRFSDRPSRHGEVRQSKLFAHFFSFSQGRSHVFCFGGTSNDMGRL